MAEKSLMIDLDDPRAAKVAEVISNPTCKKILYVLADREMSESEIASTINAPLNTVGYNVKKLVESGLVEKTSGVLWSVKGKRIVRYKVSGKRIVISPKQRVRGVIPAIIAALGVAGVAQWMSFAEKSVISETAPLYAASERAVDVAMPLQSAAESTGFGPAIWVIIGAIVFAVVLAIANWRKIW